MDKQNKYIVQTVISTGEWETVVGAESESLADAVKWVRDVAVVGTYRIIVVKRQFKVVIEEKRTLEQVDGDG